MGLVSVIVPVYNVEGYLEECVGSIMAQTHADLEVICVDDASTDGSPRLLGELAGRDPRLRVVTLPSCDGVSAARNAGMRVATGSYVLFVDADDAIDPHLVEHALSRAVACSADMTIFGFDEWHARSGAHVPREMCREHVGDATSFALADLEGVSTSLVTPNVWRILFRREFLEANGLSFHEDLPTSEDLAFIYEALLCDPALALLDERLYHYRRDGGATLTRSSRGDAGIRALRHIFGFAEGRGLAHDDVTLRHLVNLVLDVVEYATGSAATAEEYALLYDSFKRDWLPLVLVHEGMVVERYRPFLDSACSSDALGHLFGMYRGQRDAAEGARARLASLEGEVEGLRCALEAAASETDAVRSSHSYRVGNALMRVPSAIRNAVRGRSAPTEG